MSAPGSDQNGELDRVEAHRIGRERAERHFDDLIACGIEPPAEWPGSLAHAIEVVGQRFAVVAQREAMLTWRRLSAAWWARRENP